MINIPSLFDNQACLVVREIRDSSSAIKMLLAAIIRRAAFDIALYKDSKKLVDKRLAIQASQWMFDDRDVSAHPPSDRFTSFLSICEILDQDPGWIRARTQKLRAADVRKFDRVGSL